MPKKHLAKTPFLFVGLLAILINFPLAAPIAEAQQSRPLKYYGADTVFPEDFATLAQYHINTALVALSAGGSESSWQPYFTAADTYGINVVVWPTGGGGACGFPYSGSDISPAHRLLDFLGGQERFVGIVNAHEPFWSCLMSIEEMAGIRTNIKDYVRQNHSREVEVFNYIDNISGGLSDQDIGRIMDVANTWQHCIGGAEGSCEGARDSILQDRARINNAGLDGQVDLTYFFQTFGMSGWAYRMPTAAEMRDWGCRMLETNALDGFFWYTWQNPAGYSEYLANSRYDSSGEDRWEAMSYVWENCVNQPSGTPTPTPPISPPPTPTPSPPLPTPTTTPGEPTPTPIEHCLPLGDIDCSGKVNSLDFSYLIAHYDTSDPKADLDDSGKVNALDVSVLLANFGKE